MVRQPVEDGGVHGAIAEDLAPFADRAVRGEEQAAALVMAGDELEEQVRRVGLTATVPSLPSGSKTSSSSHPIGNDESIRPEASQHTSGPALNSRVFRAPVAPQYTAVKSKPKLNDDQAIGLRSRTARRSTSKCAVPQAVWWGGLTAPTIRCRESQTAVRGASAVTSDPSTLVEPLRIDTPIQCSSSAPE